MRKNIVMLVAIIAACMVACSNINTAETVESNVYRNNLHSEKRPNIDINTYRAVAQKLDGAIDDILEEKTK